MVPGKPPKPCKVYDMVFGKVVSWAREAATGCCRLLSAAAARGGAARGGRRLAHAWPSLRAAANVVRPPHLSPAAQCQDCPGLPQLGAQGSSDHPAGDAGKTSVLCLLCLLCCLVRRLGAHGPSLRPRRQHTHSSRPFPRCPLRSAEEGAERAVPHAGPVQASFFNRLQLLATWWLHDCVLRLERMAACVAPLCPLTSLPPPSAAVHHAAGRT